MWTTWSPSEKRFLKIRRGRGAEVRRCSYTNYCEGLDQRHKEVTCQLWDRSFDSEEEGVSMAADGRRRLIAPPWVEGDPSDYGG